MRPFWNGRAEAHVISSLADLLEKLTNLTKLQILDTARVWRLCGNLFRRCSFRLRHLTCQFSLDKDFSFFLESQPSLREFTWVPSQLKDHSDSEKSQLCELPPSALPHLSLYRPMGKGARSHDLLSGRPIVHFRSFALDDWATELVRNLAHSTEPLKSLHIQLIDADFLRLLPHSFPFLEYLGSVNFARRGVVSTVRTASSPVHHR
jgi:hypothetical protein